VLTAKTDPWLGQTFRATASGLTSNSLAVAAYGLNAISFPLQVVLPEALPGCMLLTSLDLLAVVPTVAGAAQTELLLPNSPAAIGATLEHQVVAAEVTGALITAITASNSLTLTIGTW
jgi:hypothetical protein